MQRNKAGKGAKSIRRWLSIWFVSHEPRRKAKTKKVKSQKAKAKSQ